MNKKFLFFLLVLVIATPSSAITVEDLVSQMHSRQGEVKDLQADLEITMISTIPNMPKITQTGRITSKGNDKVKMEMFSPQKQVMVTNGENFYIIDPASGKVVSESKASQQAFGSDPQKYLDYFDFTLKESGDGKYLLEGRPKGSGASAAAIDRMQLYIDKEKFTAAKIVIYDASGKAISTSQLDYGEISGIWVLTKIISSMNLPMGTMNMVTEYKNIRVNEGISDDVFEVE